MPAFSERPIADFEDILRFEAEKPFAQRCDARSVYDIFRKGAANHPERVALTMVITGADDERPRQVSYGELLDGITRAAQLFSSIGGQRPGVAYLLPTLVETHLTLWGAETAGYAVPVNFLLQPEHIAELIRASGAKILVALGPHANFDIWEKATAVRALLPELRLVQVAVSDIAPTPGEIDFVAALNAQPGVMPSFKPAGRDSDTAAYFHTGGTTGAPKLIAQTHINQIVASFGGAVLQDIEETDKLLSGLPMFHAAATISCGLSYFMAGAELVLLSPEGMRNPLMLKNYWRIVARTGATVIGGVPTTLAALLNVPVDADISSVRRSVSGAAMLPLAVAREFEAMTRTKVYEILGMTETAGLIAIDPFAGERVLGSAGCRLPYTQVEVRRIGNDGSVGEACAPHEIGVMTVSGPHVTPGYRDSGQNAELQSAGYLNSGDLAYFDESGRLFMAGRAKDLIIRGGHNIDPQMIESALEAHPAVALAAAVGQPDRYAGELPVCYVALRPGMKATSSELMRFAQLLIAERPAWPKQVFIVDAIPLTGVGKIFKPSLRVDATRRVALAQIASAADIGDVELDVAVGGKRGMNVTVTLAKTKASLRSAIENALDGFVFERNVEIRHDEPHTGRSPRA